MSLVGPRPWPPSMVANQVANGFTYRNEFVAGWTGPVQVQKGVAEPADYTALDVAYVDRCRSATAAALVQADIALLWRTVKAIARGEGLQFLTVGRAARSSRRSWIGFATLGIGRLSDYPWSH